MNDSGISVDRVRGLLLGTALGDALGLPAEGMGPAAIHRRFGRMDRFRMLGATGFVSDDTEQAALVAESLVLHPTDAEACARRFRHELIRWFFRLPFGVGLATVRACLRASLGMSPSGVPSAGNGAMMRAAVIGAVIHDPQQRAAFGRRLAEVTHRDARAVEAALYVAEVAAACTAARPEVPRTALCTGALHVVREPALREPVERAIRLATGDGPGAEAVATELGTTGYAPHTAARATYGFLRPWRNPLEAVSDLIAAGGDTDTAGAVLGALVGALHGETALPADLLDRIHDGPYGPSHLRALAGALAGEGPLPSYSRTAALARNLSLYPVVLAHGIRRLVP